MKLLLTSNGIANQTIQNKFIDLVGKQPKDISVAYIPTAINVASVQDKRWAVDSIVSLNNMGIGVIDIVDFSAIPKDLWLPRLKAVDVLYVEGGTPVYLLDEMKKVDLPELFASELADKVYVGCSTGACIMGKMMIKTAKDAPEGYKIIDCLGMVKFSIRPHYRKSGKEMFDDNLIAKIASGYPSVIYAIDDDTAIAVEDGQVEVVSEGKWKRFEA